MNSDIEKLAMTTARILRAYIRDHVEGAPVLAATMHEDVRCLDEALAPFDGVKAEPVNEEKR